MMKIRYLSAMRNLMPSRWDFITNTHWSSLKITDRPGLEITFQATEFELTVGPGWIVRYCSCFVS